jgi:hypothetical protein
MSSSIHNLDFPGEGRISLPPSLGATISAEAETRTDPQTTFVEHDLWFSGMAKVAENISDVIVNRLREISNVQAVLMGRSGEVYHVWTMIRNWTAMDRRAVYGAQKELLTKLNGFDLDFYVVRLDEGVTPDALVSDIPLVFQRAS